MKTGAMAEKALVQNHRRPDSRQGNPTLASIGIDIGKNIFHLVSFDADGRIVLRRKIKRLTLGPWLRCSNKMCSRPATCDA